MLKNIGEHQHSILNERREFLQILRIAVPALNNVWSDAVTRQLRWRTEASGWAASAACPTIRLLVWDTLEDFFTILTT
jgi:hypothetical protein